MNTIDLIVYSTLATAALIAILYGLPYVLIALVAIGAIHGYPQFKQWFCRTSDDMPPSA